VLTNVLAPTRLSAEEALDLYPYRWSVERMFFDLKCVRRPMVISQIGAS
jgi:hypothetical protein